MSMAQGADFNWLAAVVDADGRALANAVLLDHLEGLVPEAVLDAEGGCTLRFPEGFTKRATELHRALGVAAVETGGETGPRRAPVAARVAATLAGPCTILTVDRSGRIAEHPGQFAAGGSAVTLSAARRSGQVLAGAPVLLDGGIVAVTRAANAGDGVEVVNLGELFAALSPPEPAQAASKGPSAQAADVPAPPLPFSGSTRTAYGLAVAIGSTRPGRAPADRSRHPAPRAARRGTRPAGRRGGAPLAVRPAGRAARRPAGGRAVGGARPGGPPHAGAR